MDPSNTTPATTETEITPESVAYDLFVRTLVKSPDLILSQISPNAMNLLHMAVGVAGETSELLQAAYKAAVERMPLDTITDEVLGQTLADNIMEELGDLSFYIQGICNQFGWSLADVTMDGQPVIRGVDGAGPDLLHLASTAAIHGGHLLDNVKKHAIYGQSLEDANGELLVVGIRDQLGILMGCIEVICADFGYNLEDVRHGNKVKLLKRYKKLKYSDAAAKSRDDKQSA